MKAATDIRRVVFTEPDTLVDERAKLAKQASSLLGYSGLAKAMPGKLAETLRKLDIHPLVKADVEAYKLRKAKPGMWSNHQEALALLAITLVLAVSARLCAFYGNWSTPFSLAGVAVILWIITGVAAIGTAISLLSDHSRSRITRSWQAVDLARYLGNVPEFALAKAIAIKEALPQAVFNVHYLVETEERIERRMPDPFLKVILGDESYYLDVWDEKEYEARM